MQRTSLNSGCRNCMETPLLWSMDAFPGHVRFGCSDKANGVELGLGPPSAPIPDPAKLESSVGWDFFCCWWSSDRVESGRPAASSRLAVAAGGEHELRFGEQSSCAGRAPDGCEGEGVLGSRRAGPGLGAARGL